VESRNPTQKGVPEVEPAPSERGLGAGAEGLPSAGGAPTKVVCKEFYYRRNINTMGRTQYYIIDPQKWEILKPTRTVRSKSGAHGEDIYCFSEEVWNRVIIIKLERSNSGKLRYEVSSPQEYWWNKIMLESVLMLAEDFHGMEEEIREYVKLQRSKKEEARSDECA